jgi:hypothetical protein
MGINNTFITIKIKLNNMNKETLEEAVERIYDDNLFEYQKYRNGFIQGTKWQAERMYSEEEVIEIAKQYAKRCQAPIQSTEWLLEQFKKK